MTFNSNIFAWLFLATVCLHWLVRHDRSRKLLLLVASFSFYAWWSLPFSSLLLYSIVLDYSVGRQLGRTSDPGRRGLLLLVSLCGNLGVLAFFKYTNFLVASSNTLLELFSLGGIPLMNIVLPLGISFYTFQTLSYAIDVYRGEIPPATSFLDFAVFVSFFPQLVAGPIVRARDFLPQLAIRRRLRFPAVSMGLFEMIYGLFLKVVIADNLAPAVDDYFDPVGYWRADLGPLFSWRILYCFSFQIFCDFAGYSLLAIGAARVLGYRLMKNFDYPYIAESFSEFWRRWHMSLSTWLRDYLYISLGGNRGTEHRTRRNLMLTMLLGGLWHGASWTFVAWGALHGLYLIAGRMRGARPASAQPRHRWRELPLALGRIFVVFHLTALTWVLFRATDFHQAWHILGNLLPSFSGATTAAGAAAVLAPRSAEVGLYLAIATALFIFQFLRQKSPLALPRNWGRARALPVLASIMLFLLIVVGGESHSFVYFVF